MNVEQADLLALAQLENTCDPEELLSLTGSYARMEALFRILPRVERGRWFQLLGHEWSGCDNIGRYTDVLKSVLYFADPAHIELMMTEEERAFRDSLPPIFTAWRGCYEHNWEGLSYSLHRDIAARFPYLARYRAKGRPLLLTAKVWREQAIVKLGREEFEVIAIDPELVGEKRLPEVRDTCE